MGLIARFSIYPESQKSIFTIGYNRFYYDDDSPRGVVSCSLMRSKALDKRSKRFSIPGQFLSVNFGKELGYRNKFLGEVEFDGSAILSGFANLLFKLVELLSIPEWFFLNVYHKKGVAPVVQLSC